MLRFVVCIFFSHTKAFIFSVAWHISKPYKISKCTKLSLVTKNLNYEIIHLTRTMTKNHSIIALSLPQNSFLWNWYKKRISLPVFVNFCVSRWQSQFLILPMKSLAITKKCFTTRRNLPKTFCVLKFWIN